MKNLILICCIGSFSFMHAQSDSLKQADNSTLMAKTLDKTDQALAKAIEKGMEVASKTGEFVVSQAPDLVKQFYVWSLVKNSIWIIFGLCLVIFGLKLPRMLLDKSAIYREKKFTFKYGNWYYDYENIPAICALILFISGAGTWILIDHIYDIAYLLSAPKLYLIEAFADLFK